MEDNNTDKKSLAENLYKQNIEIVGKNKILSLLSKLYSVSILTLSPDQTAKQMADIITGELSLESVGILMIKGKSKNLEALVFSNSKRLHNLSINLEKEVLSIKPLTNNFISKIITSKEKQYSESLEEVWDSLFNLKIIKLVKEGSHIRSTIAYPLVVQDQVAGVIMFSSNRSFDEFADYEKESIKSCVDVVSVALDKSLLYKELTNANQKLKALDKARAEFISIASHQLRTPPATIKWYLAAITSGDFGEINPEAMQAIKRTMATNDAQIATISDLLNASRIERGKLEFFFESADILSLVEQLTNQLVPLAEMKKLSLVFNKPAEVFPKIVMDQEKVRQVINNMIDNAIKYSKEGQIAVEIKLVDKNIQFSVTDQGQGLSKTETAKLFEKFTRGENSATQATGLGLGMYVAKVVIDQHNGKIWADSAGKGKGSTFYFTLPIANKIKTSFVDLVEAG